LLDVVPLQDWIEPLCSVVNVISGTILLRVMRGMEHAKVVLAYAKLVRTRILVYPVIGEL
jgi:hypothetical protein